MSNSIDTIAPAGAFPWTPDAGAEISDNVWQLTERESRVASLLAVGLPYKEIALELSISINTVASHVKSILRKAGVNSSRRFAAMWQARQRGV